MARELDAAESYSQKNKVLFHLPPSSTFSLVDSSKMTLKSICTPKLETLLSQTLLFHVGYYDIDSIKQGNNQLDLLQMKSLDHNLSFD